jgi:hypothetical protein
MWGTHATVVRVVPILAKPSNVSVKLFPGFFEVQVSGPRGAKGFYKLPLAPLGSGRLLVANFVSCSIRRLHQVASVGRGFVPVLSVDILCRDPWATLVAPSIDVLQELVEAGLDGEGSEDVAPDAQAVLEIPPEALPVEMISNAAQPPIVLRRSPRLALIEEAKYMSVIDKASSRKHSKMEGKRGPSRLGLLPAKELFELAKEGLLPLDDYDVGLLAKDCDAVLGEVPASG